MQRLTMLLIICSLSACAKPDVPVCVNNVQAKHKKCYNLGKDYDDDGRILPSASPTYMKLETVQDVDKDVSTTLDGLVQIKILVKNQRNKVRDLEAQLKACESR